MKKSGKIIIPDGKICCGKSTYSRKMRDELNGVYLCIDEAILRVFGETPDMEKIGPAYGKLIEYVMEMAAQFAENGVDVVFESGYFSKAERDWYKDFFRNRGVNFEWHYLDVSDETWKKAISKRNEAHEMGDGGVTFPITDEFLKMFNENYVIPERDEVDVWVDNNW